MNEPPAVIWSPEVPFPAVADMALPDRICHVMLHRGGDAYRFLHESSIVRHGDSFFAAWNNSPRAESERGTVVRWIRANDDFSRRGEPLPVAPALDHATDIWESVQLLSADGVLWAFIGRVHHQPRTPEVSGGAMTVFRFDEQRQQWAPQGEIAGFHPLSRPQRTAGGHWVMGGQYNLVQPRVAVSRGDDLACWDVVEIPDGPQCRINYAETALAVDGDTVTAYVRSTIECVFTAKSRDGGRHWSRLQPSNLPMSSSKVCAGRFSTGQRFLAFNPPAPGLGRRDVLAVAVTAPGETHFRKLVLLRRGASPNPRIDGHCKAPQWAYPSVEEHNGQVHITYSVTKEDCCLSILPLEEFRVKPLS